MKKIQMTALVAFLTMGFITAAQASHNPDRVREVFALSGDSKLQLAAEALGDDQLLKMLDELKKSGDTQSGSIQKTLRKLK